VDGKDPLGRQDLPATRCSLETGKFPVNDWISNSQFPHPRRVGRVFESHQHF